LLSTSCAARRAARSGTDAEEALEEPSILSERSRVLDKLKRAAKEQIETAEQRRLEDESTVRSAPPYFYRRFELYPEGADEPEISLKETDSSLKPYEADVAVRKARFTTKYHTSRTVCAQDKEFIRDVGMQTDTYVYENRQWNLVYSLFEVEETRVLRGDEWVDVTGKAERMAQDRGVSFFGRVGGFFRTVF
jgi:ParB-like chromosome segregation protein Spo0J